MDAKAESLSCHAQHAQLGDAHARRQQDWGCRRWEDCGGIAQHAQLGGPVVDRMMPSKFYTYHRFSFMGVRLAGLVRMQLSSIFKWGVEGATRLGKLTEHTSRMDRVAKYLATGSVRQVISQFSNFQMLVSLRFKRIQEAPVIAEYHTDAHEQSVASPDPT